MTTKPWTRVQPWTLEDPARVAANYPASRAEFARDRKGRQPAVVQLRSDGCSIAEHCVACPLPACKWDLPNGIGTLKAMANAENIRNLRATGRTFRQIAHDLGLSVRTVSRALSKALA